MQKEYTRDDIDDDDDVRQQQQRHYWLSRIGESRTSFRELNDAPEYIRADKRIIMAAIKKHGSALEYAVPSIRSDKPFVMEAVSKFGCALKYASPSLQDDKEVVIAAVKKWGYALKYASPRLRKDKEVVMEAIKCNPESIRKADPLLQNDKEIAIEAVRRSGWAYQFISPTRKMDKEVAMIAVRQFGVLLAEVPGELRKDKVVVLEAIRSNPDSIKYAYEDIRRDPDILTMAGMFDLNHKERAVADAAAAASTTTNPPSRSSSSVTTILKSTTYKKVALSTRFSLNPKTSSDATRFTKLLKEHEYIRSGDFKIYVPNAFDKHTCDPKWTDFNHPCRGTPDTCLYSNVLTHVGRPTDDCCWRYSFRYQLEEAKETGGFLLQLIERDHRREEEDDNDESILSSDVGNDENNKDDYGDGDATILEHNQKPQTLGNGQKIERDMAKSIGCKIFHVYRPMSYSGLERRFDNDAVNDVVMSIKMWYDEGCHDMSECILRPTVRPYGGKFFSATVRATGNSGRQSNNNNTG